MQSGLSPGGVSIFFSPGTGIGAPTPVTRHLQLGTGGPYATVAGHTACLWIDEDHLLAPDAVIGFPSLRRPATKPGADDGRRRSPASGECAGRFPGGL